MSLTLFLSEDHVTKMVPTLCRVVGIVFIVGGVLALFLIPVLFFGKGENIVLISLILCGSAFVNIGLGVVILKYMAKFMLSRFHKLRENPFFRK